jgi:hypothetical protein
LAAISTGYAFSVILSVSKDFSASVVDSLRLPTALAMSESIKIMRERWREVLLLFGIEVIADLYYFLPRELRGWGLLGSFIAMLFSMVLGTGFLRLACLEGSRPQTTREIWKVGKHFFWRMIQFGLLVAFVFLVTMVGVHLILRYAKPNFSSSVSHRVIMSVSINTVLVLLMKPVICIPTAIVIRDCSLKEAWASIRRFRLRKAPLLMVLYVMRLLLILWFLHFKSQHLHDLCFAIIFPVHRAVGFSLSMILSLEAIRIMSTNAVLVTWKDS